MQRKDVIRDTVRAAEEFNGRRLWMRFANVHCFGVRFSDREDSLLGVVLGAGREEFGLSLFREPGAAAALASLFQAGGTGDDALADLDMLGFSMDTFGNLSPEAQALLREADLHPRFDEQVPGFLAKPAGQRARVVNESELTLLLSILRAVVKADKTKQLQPATLDDRDGICVLTIGGDPSEPRVSVTREKWRSSEAPRAVPLPPGGADLQGLPILEETWLIGTPALRAGIQGDDRAMQLLLVADEGSEYVFEARAVFAGDLEEAVAAIVAVFRQGPYGRKGLPRRIVCSNRKLHEALTSLLEPLGGECTFQAVIPKLREIADGFLEHMGDPASFTADEVEAASAPEAGVPAPDDLKGWKEADRRLFQRFMARLKSDERLRSPRAARRYFDDDDLQHYFKEHEMQGVGGAYMSWAILDCRPSKVSKTRGEEMLEEGLPAPEAMLLRARMAAYPTLYRVAGHDPRAGTIDLEDVLLGGTVKVHDQLMSENIEEGLFFCARVFAAGRFHFLDLAGPPLGAGMGMEAVTFLQANGMEFTLEGLRRDAHKFGWLWGWIEDWEANWKPPRLCNTDGDPLFWHTASFGLADPAATRQALLQRPDIHYDDVEEKFIWTRETGKGAKMLGGPVTMGHMEFVGDELVLTVNSARRFAEARAWLETLPGVTFRDVKTRQLDEAEKDRPMDERMPGPAPVKMTPELTQAVQDLLDKQYMSWIDRPLPVLGGRTPRQACETEAGRQQVEMLIRTMPEPSGPAPIRVPREAIRRALGLAGEPSSPPSDPATVPPSGPSPSVDSPAEVPSSQRPAAPARTPHVPRNAPCPCGSGRKYKKCCGQTVR